MVIVGPKTKTRKGPSVHLDYIIHIQEIKPWPPSQSLRTLRSVLIQWDHGDRASGSTSQVVPSLGTGSGVGDGRIEFNESIRLSVTLTRELSLKAGNGDTFQKNCIEFNLYEPRRGKAVKGQLIGTAVLDLADHGIVKENLSISVPVNCQRSYGNTVQPLLFVNIQPVDRRRLNSSARDSLTREPSMNRNRAESVSALMSEEYAEEEAEVASSFTTDDDVSSHSSNAVPSLAAESNGSSSPPQSKENGIVTVNGSAGEETMDHAAAPAVVKSREEQDNEYHVNSAKGSSHSSSMDLSSDLAWISRKIGGRASSVEKKEKQPSFNVSSNEPHKESDIIKEDGLNTNRDTNVQLSPNVDHSSVSAAEVNSAESNGHAYTEFDSMISQQEDHEKASSPYSDSLLVDEKANDAQDGCSNDESRAKQDEHFEETSTVEGREQESEGDLSIFSSQSDAQKPVTSGNDMLSSSGENGAISSISNVDRIKHGKSVRSLSDSSRKNGSIRSNQLIVADTQNNGQGYISSERKDPKLHTKETKNQLLESKVQQLEHRVKVLEGELREAAGIEISLYSVIAEHGSSTTKVHAPARRLSRLYFHASKQNSKPRRASAAKSIVSGLVLVAKACGNDVPRLSFWLSNVIVLRVIMSKSFVDSQLPISFGSVAVTVSGDKNANKKTSPLKWGSSSPYKINMRSTIEEENFCGWEDPRSFVSSLEKVEQWMFSRIIESLWWQTFTPHMQSGAAKAIRKSIDTESSKLSRSNSIEQQQGNYSLELWKRAFRDASERICPLRAEGHDCGCMPVLSRLIMEQLIARLDVAMFNAILRESADEMPTDPVADPISDSEVLPIPAGKTSFGAGAQLKNAIGNWCRWLTDFFGIDDDHLIENGNCLQPDYDDEDDDDERRSHDASSKCFRLLNALSDLMMLPKDMLLSRTIRKEVCPTFGTPLIRRVLNSFIPDEFCPDPIPGVVLEALNSEDPYDDGSDDVDTTVNFPCDAPPIIYQTPSSASIAAKISLEEIGNSDSTMLRSSGSSILKKSQTSDDELDELDSPLKSIVLDGFQPSPSSFRPGWTSKKSESRVNVTRYQLLREAWNE